MKTAYLLLLMFCGTAYSGNPLAVYNEDNLIRSDYFRPLVSFYNTKTLWQPHKKQKFEILDHTLVMKAGGKAIQPGFRFRLLIRRRKHSMSPLLTRRTADAPSP